MTEVAEHGHVDVLKVKTKRGLEIGAVFVKNLTAKLTLLYNAAYLGRCMISLVNSTSTSDSTIWVLLVMRRMTMNMMARTAMRKKWTKGSSRLSTEAEIDGHEQGEEEFDEDDDGVQWRNILQLRRRFRGRVSATARARQLLLDFVHLSDQ